MMSIDRVSAKFGEVVHADDRVIVTAPDIIHPRFEFYEIIDVGSTFSRPIHVTDNATEWKSALSVAAGQLLEHSQHAILIETAIPKVCFGVAQKFELPSLPPRRSCQSPPRRVASDDHGADPD